MSKRNFMLPQISCFRPIDLSSNLDSIFMIRHRNELVSQQCLNFLSSLQMIGNFEAISFQEHLFQQSSLPQLIEQLELITQGNLFSVQPNVISNRKQFLVEDALWFNPSSFQTFSSWLGNAFEKEISLAYFKSKRRFEPAEYENSI